MGDKEVEVAPRVEANKTTARTITVWWMTGVLPEFDLISKSLFFHRRPKVALQARHPPSSDG
jgi:hypothetical protein